MPATTTSPAAPSAPAKPKAKPAAAPPRQKGSLRYKFGSSVTLLLVLTILGISYLALRGEEQALREEMKQRGITIARNLAANASKSLLTAAATDRLGIMSLVKEAMANKSVTYAVVVDEKGMIAAHNDVAFAEKPYQRPPGVPELDDQPLEVSEPFLFKSGKNPDIKIVDIGVPVLIQG